MFSKKFLVSNRVEIIPSLPKSWQEKITRGKIFPEKLDA